VIIPQYWILEPFVDPVKIVDKAIHKIMNMNEIEFTFIQNLRPSLTVDLLRSILDISWRTHGRAYCDSKFEFRNVICQVRFGKQRVTVNVLVENDKNRLGVERFRVKNSLKDIVQVSEQGFMHADQNSAK